MENGYYWMKGASEPWQVVEITYGAMYFCGSDVGASRADGGAWKYDIGGQELEIEQMVRIEPPGV
jgi:hypothetical protein